jgi:hypothetical protein
MKSQHTFALSFYLKRENEVNGKAPIYAKITVDGKYFTGKLLYWGHDQTLSLRFSGFFS